MLSIGMVILVILGGLLAAGLGGCARPFYDPQRATRPYPDHLHSTDVVNMHVFREGDRLVIVNSTARSYHDFDLWINQRFVQRIEALPIGETIRVPLADFYDMRGDAVRAGGFFRTVEPTRIRLVQMQISPDEPLIGLITIVEDAARPRL